jgi:uncharacterized protein
LSVMARRFVRRSRRFPGLIVAVLALFVAYVGLRLIPTAWPLAGVLTAWVALSSTIALPLLLMLAIRRGTVGEGVFPYALMPVAFFLFLLTFTVPRDVVWAILSLIGTAPTEYFDVTSGGVVVLAALTFASGFVGARGGPTVVDVRVPIDNLHPDLDGFTIAQISDVHIGRTLKRPFLERVVDQVNALEADLVAITGDLVDGHVDDLRQHTEPLRDLKARHGVWFVPGNHDYYSGVLAWVAELERLGLRVLLNAHDVIEHAGQRLVVGGVTDHTAHVLVDGHQSDPHKAIAGAPEDAFKLLLAHQPASAKEAARAGFDLQLSGHTHGGQFFPGTILAHLVFPFVAGLAKHESMWIYTHRGTGFVGPPLRHTLACEVTRLVLVRA